MNVFKNKKRLNTQKRALNKIRKKRFYTYGLMPPTLEAGA